MKPHMPSPARASACATTEIVMFPIGGLSRMDRVLKPVEELWVSLSGPLTNVLLSLGIFAYMAYMHQ